MKKAMLFCYALSIPLLAQSLKEGLYVSQECHVMIGIENPYRDHYEYRLYGTAQPPASKTLEIGDQWITFTGLHAVYYADSDGGEMVSGDIGSVAGAQLDTPERFSLQNYGNSMNPFIILDGCSKYLDYTRIDSAAQLLERFKRDDYKIAEIGSYFWFNDYRKYFKPMIQEEVAANNLAFYLYQSGRYDEAEALLSRIVDRLPDRTVAHLNYADALKKMEQAGHGDPSLARMHDLTYIAQMLFDKRGARIPQRLRDAHAEMFPLLDTLNRTLKKKYVVLKTAKGDLNADGVEDHSVVIALADRNSIDTPEGMEARAPDRNPRIWFVWLGGTDGYRLIGKNSTLIAPDEHTHCDDPLDAISIKQNSLYLETHYWCSAGGWGQGNATVQFLYRDGALLLAGKEEFHDSRATGEGEMISTNYLSGRRKVQKTVDHGDPDGPPVWSHLENAAPVYFDAAAE